MFAAHVFDLHQALREEEGSMALLPFGTSALGQRLGLAWGPHVWPCVEEGTLGFDILKG